MKKAPSDRGFFSSEHRCFVLFRTGLGLIHEPLFSVAFHKGLHHQIMMNEEYEERSEDQYDAYGKQ